MTDKTYNGWTNWETWVTNLHFDDAYTEQAEEFYEDAEADDTFTRIEKASFDLAEYIEQDVEEYIEASGAVGINSLFVQDIVSGFLSDVNWYEIARHYIEEAAQDDEVAA